MERAHGGAVDAAGVGTNMGCWEPGVVRWVCLVVVGVLGMPWCGWWFFVCFEGVFWGLVWGEGFFWGLSYGELM